MNAKQTLVLNQNLVKLVHLLQDGQYHDGTSIGKILNITRSGVWKLIKKLEQYQVDFTSVKGKGYQLNESLILLDAEKIHAALGKIPLKIDVLEKVDSTNQYLKLSQAPSEQIHLCLAEMQTKGRGRLNRTWYSPFGKNIYFSMRYPFQKDLSELSGLSLMVALGVAHTLDTIMGHSEKIKLKWPNDVMVQGEKIAGILIEIQAESHGFSQVVIGIGLNVNETDANENNITQPWSSLKKLTGIDYDRNGICAELISKLLSYLQRFSASGLSDFHAEWQERDLLFGKPVELTSGNQAYSGIAQGIDAQGHLLLKLPDGSLKGFSSGDTSLRKQ